MTGITLSEFFSLGSHSFACQCIFTLGMLYIHLQSLTLGVHTIQWVNTLAHAASEFCVYASALSKYAISKRPQKAHMGPSPKIEINVANLPLPPQHGVVQGIPRPQSCHAPRPREMHKLSL